MGKHEEPKKVTRREVLALAGTAAAFCTDYVRVYDLVKEE